MTVHLGGKLRRWSRTTGFFLPAYLASVSGSYWDFTNLGTLSQDAAGTIPVTAIGDPIGRVVDTINAKNGTQSGASLRPVLQSAGAKFDGSDDNLLTSYLAGAGSNFIVALVTVPASIAAFQYICGANDAASANRFSFGINTDGLVGFGVGNTSPLTAKGTSDVRGLDVVIGLSGNGSIARGFVAAVQEYPNTAMSGSFTTTYPIRLGATNAAGTAGTFFGGSIKRLVAGKDFLTLARYQQIRSALLAA